MDTSLYDNWGTDTSELDNELYRPPDFWLDHERGERDGINGTPSRAMLSDPHYTAGYHEGFIERKARERVEPFYDLWGYAIQGRYPNSPPYPAIG